MVKDTFRGGVHPDGHKELSREMPLQDFFPKGEMVFPLSQHIGKPAKPIVKKNDPVLVGQRIAEADGFVSAHVICSCSGTVKAVEKRMTLSGAMAECIVVENDGQFTPIEGMGVREDDDDISNAELLRRVQDAGIVGLGGAGFPTHVKLQPKNPDAIRYVIANGAECEPYLTCNDQLMRVKADAIVEGLQLMLRLFPNAEGVICIERNKPVAIAAMKQAAAGKPRIRVLDLKTKYPQGGERSLIQVVAGLDFPMSMLPLAVTYMASDKAGNIDDVLFRFKEDALTLTWREGDETNTVKAGLDGRYCYGEMLLGGVNYKVCCTAKWLNNNSLFVSVRPIETIGKRMLEFRFRGDKVTMLPSSSPTIPEIAEFLEKGFRDMCHVRIVQKAAHVILSILPPIVEPKHRGRFID